MITKKFSKKPPLCTVDFILPDEIATIAETACLVGDFNDWNGTATPMKKVKGSAFRVTVKLDVDQEYAFRYLINGSEWHNEPKADKFVENPFNGENSVVTTYSPVDPQ